MGAKIILALSYLKRPSVVSKYRVDCIDTHNPEVIGPSMVTQVQDLTNAPISQRFPSALVWCVESDRVCRIRWSVPSLLFETTTVKMNICTDGVMSGSHDGFASRLA